MNTTQKFFITVGAGIALMLVIMTTQACADVRQTVDKQFSVDAGGTLIIDSDRGSIEIKTVEENEVKVSVIYEADVMSEQKAESIFEDFVVDFSQKGNNVIISGKVDKDLLGIFDGNNRLRIKYKVTVPERFNAELATAGGSIIVGDLHGKLQAKTAGGSLDFGNITGKVDGKTAGGSIKMQSAGDDVDLKTAGGSITVGPVNGDAEAITSGGSVRIGEVSGTLVAHTSGGSISIDGVGGSIDAKASGGSIRASVTEQPKDDCQLTTSGGSISVSLPENIGLNIKARTYGGKVSTDLPITVRGEISKSHIEGTLNGGGPAMILETSGGNISITKSKELL